ncbi:hypothetical protein LLG10_01935 [bacterium]|nr:hypothetical protein [bacterium]
MKKSPLGFFETYLSLWVAVCMIAGVLTEVPVMLHLVSICKKTKHWFPSDWERNK